MFSRLRKAVAAFFAPLTGGKRMYAAAKQDRLTADWNSLNSSSDSEIVQSLRTARARSRQLVRDNEYARNAVRIIQNNVIGDGIKMQAMVKNQRGTPVETANDQIEEEWEDWWLDKSKCHTGGLLAGPDIERLLIGNLVENGEAIIRLVRKPFGDSQVALALEVIESDRLVDQWSMPKSPNGNNIRMGVEVDQWGRPLAYWCYPTHPGDYQFTNYQPESFLRIPADEIIHLYIVDRWPQTRGMPWFSSAMRRLNNMGGYEEAEIVAARGSAAVMGFITSSDVPTPDAVVNGQQVSDFSAGQIRHLQPGESFTGWNPSRPNANMDPFMRLMLRGIAAGVGCSYESLSRDYSQSNYSSSRLALLDDRDLWRVLQGWFIRNFRTRLHKEFLHAAVLPGVLQLGDFYTSLRKYQAVRFKPRGWSWIDPSKETIAYRMAVRAGFMTVSDVIALTGNGNDAETVFKTRRQELDDMAELDLVFDTDPAQVNDKGIAQPNTAPEEELDKPAEPGEMPGADEADPAEPADPEPAATDKKPAKNAA